VVEPWKIFGRLGNQMFQMAFMYAWSKEHGTDIYFQDPKYFEKYAINLGGTIGSLGIQKERTAFKNKNNTVVAAPIVCYESVYSEYVSEYVRNGANILFIVTNDGWWDDTPGYKQHLAYARLRAIENRRSIARSANTGISAFYNQRGDILQQSQWWKPMALKQTLNINNEETMFTKLGDFIYKIAVLLSLGLLGLILLKKFKRN
jgi:apolipoprotein N-acyltransferase